MTAIIKEDYLEESHQAVETSKTNVKSQPKEDNSKPLTMISFLIAYNLFKKILSKAVILQEQATAVYYKVENKAMLLADKALGSAASTSDEISKEGKASEPLAIVGMILGFLGAIAMFIPGLQGVGAALMIGAGACLVASGGLQISSGVKMQSIAEKKGNAMKDQAVTQQSAMSVQGMSTQLNDTAKSKSALEKTINSLIVDYAKAEQSAGPRQSYVHRA